MASAKTARIAQTSAFVVETLEARALFSVTIDTGYGWKISAPDGTSFAPFQMVGPQHDHLLVREKVTYTGTTVPLTFTKSYPNLAPKRAVYFALDAQFKNNDPAGGVNHFSWSIVHFGTTPTGVSYPDAGNTANHPDWAHFHVNGGRVKNFAGTITPDNPYPGGKMQNIDITGLNVPYGQTLRLGGGTLTEAGSTAPETGFRMHFTENSPGDSFSLYQSLSYKPAPDRFESNNNFAQATDLGKIEYRKEDNLTIHLNGSYGEVDYYKFKALSSKFMGVKAIFSQVQGDLDMYVYDSTQHLIGSSTGTVDNASVFFTAQANAVYYVKVFGKNSNTSQRNYSLLINTVSVQLNPIATRQFGGTSGLFNGHDRIGAASTVDTLDVSNREGATGKLLGVRFL